VQLDLPRPTETWQPIMPWVEGLSCDTMLISHGVIAPLRYAARWNEPLRKDPAAYAAAVSRWLDYYDREGVSGIGIGAVVLRGRDGPGWVRGLDAPRPATGAAGEHIVRLFEATDRLAGLERDDELLDDRLSLVRGHRLDQSLVFDAEYEIADVTMSLAEGIGLAAAIEPEVLPLLFELAPGRTARDAAAAAGVPAADAVPTIRRLLELGLLDQAHGS
jgi:hypothetical protein